MNSYIWQHDQLSDIQVIDGDTIKVTIDLGFDTSTTKKMRLSRIDTPELRIKEQREKALEAKAYVVDRIAKAKSIKIVSYKQGKYGRYLCDVFIDSINLNGELIEKGYAKRYGTDKKTIKRANSKT